MEVKTNVAVVGCGYWGPNIIRNFHQLPETRLVSVCDLSQDRLDYVREHYPDVDVTTDVDSLLSRSDVDAVVVTTPADNHFSLTKRILKTDKHVLVTI